MIKVFCDKCGKELRPNPATNMVPPSYRIKKINYTYSVDINLCHACELKLEEWLATRPEENE